MSPAADRHLLCKVFGCCHLPHVLKEAPKGSALPSTTQRDEGRSVPACECSQVFLGLLCVELSLYCFFLDTADLGFGH